MKTFETRIDIILIISVLIILLGISLAGIAGMVLSALLISIAGTIYGLFKKEKRIWKPLLMVSIIIIGILIFITTLIQNSNM